MIIFYRQELSSFFIFSAGKIVCIGVQNKVFQVTILLLMTVILKVYAHIATAVFSMQAKDETPPPLPPPQKKSIPRLNKYLLAIPEKNQTPPPLPPIPLNP